MTGLLFLAAGAGAGLFAGLNGRGTGRPRHEEKIRRAFRCLFAPESARWRKAALASARRALTGILTAEGLIGSGDAKQQTQEAVLKKGQPSVY